MEDSATIRLSIGLCFLIDNQPNTMQIFANEPIFRNFVKEEDKEKILHHWELHKNKYVEGPDDLIFFYLKGDSIDDRVNLRAFLSHLRATESNTNELNDTNVHAKVVVVGNDSTTFFNFYGWEEDIVFCYALIDSERSMKFLVKRLMHYPYRTDSPVEKLRIKSKGKQDTEPIYKICYCKADGNFTEIHLSNGRMRVESKAISFIEERLKSIASMERINRTFLINRNRVFRINSSKGEVYFTADKDCGQRVVTFSEVMIKRIKDFVYWY